MGNKISRMRRRRAQRRERPVITVPRVTSQWHIESDERMFDFRCQEAVRHKWSEFFHTNGRARPDSLRQLARNHNLEELVLESVGIETLPDELWGLPKLRRLVLRDPIAHMPARAVFSTLETLQICGQLTELPRFEAPELRNLTLHDNACAEMTLHAAAVPRLERLNVRNGGLTRIRLVGCFPHLHTIEASGNALSELDVCCGEQFPALRVLDVASNELSTLPADLGACVHLEELHVGNNAQLDALPSSLSQCAKLHHVAASQTQIECVPELPAVRTLEVRNCALAMWPPVHAMPELRELRVAGNRTLGDIPMALGECMHLTALDVSQTAISRIPAHLLQLHEGLRITARNCDELQACTPTTVGTRGRLLCNRRGMEEQVGLRGHESMLHDMMWASMRCSALMRRAVGDGNVLGVWHTHLTHVEMR